MPNFSLRSKLVAFFLASSILAVAAISAYLVNFYEADKSASVRKIEISAFRQRVDNLEALIQSAQATAAHAHADEPLPSNIILLAEGACDPRVPPTFIIPRRNRAHLSTFDLTPTMWTNALDFFLACRRIVEAREANLPVPAIQLLPPKIELAVPYLALLFADAAGARLALVSMDETLNPPGARIFLTESSANVSRVVWSADPSTDLAAALALAGVNAASLPRSIASTAPAALVDLSSDTLLSSASVLRRWRLVSLAHFPMIAASVAFAIREITFLAIGMLSLNVLVGLRFANLFVRPLEELRASTEKIGAGQLDFRFEINGRNEIEIVKKSFNTMTERISALIEENRRKAEVDSELKLAREVGSMLFPKDQVQLSGLEIHARMNRADQFSGEWWGYADFGKAGGPPATRILIVADLQQSGTLGALGIAALRGSAAAVEAWASARPELAADPCLVLKNLEDALVAAGRGNFQAALLTAIFDPKSQVVRCARSGTAGAIWIGPGGTQVQTVNATSQNAQAFQWQPGSKFLAFTPRLTALQPGGAIFSTELLNRAVASGASLSATGLLGTIAQARSAVVKVANYAMVAVEYPTADAGKEANVT